MSGFVRFIIKRLLFTVIVLICVSIFTFALVRIAPGNPVLSLLPMEASDEQIAALEIKLGFDKPLPVQYIKYMSGVFRGDFGTSIYYRTSVLTLIMGKLPTTATIAFGTVLFGALISIVLGVIAGSNRGKPIDFFAVAFALIGQSMASPWLAILFIYIFALKLNLLPAIGTQSGIKDYILPIATNTTVMVAVVVRMARSGMINTLNEDYITVTYAKGIRRAVVNWKYGFKNAMLPVVTILGLQLGVFLAGVVVVETIFGMSGIGNLLYEAVMSRDYPLLQSIVLICAFFISMINLIVDIINASIDPRLVLE